MDSKELRNLSISNPSDPGQSAWIRMLELYAGSIKGIARAWGLNDAEAEDALQETLLVVLWPSKEFQPKTGNPDKEFNAWVYGIARRKIWNQFRRKRAREMVSTDAPIADGTTVGATIPDPTAPPDVELERTWRQHMLQAVFAKAMQSLGATQDPKHFYIFCEVVAGAEAVNVAEVYGEDRNNVDQIVFRQKSRFCKQLAKTLQDVGLAEDEGFAELLERILDGSIRPNQIVQHFKESGIPEDWWHRARHTQPTLDGGTSLETMKNRLECAARAIQSLGHSPKSATLLHQDNNGGFHSPITLGERIIVGRGHSEEEAPNEEPLLTIGHDMRLTRRHFRISKQD